MLEPYELFWLGLRFGALPEIDIDTALGTAPRVFSGTVALGAWWEKVLQQQRQPRAAHAVLAAQATLTRLMVNMVPCTQQASTGVSASPVIVRTQIFAHEHLADEPRWRRCLARRGSRPVSFTRAGRQRLQAHRELDAFPLPDFK